MRTMSYMRSVIDRNVVMRRVTVWSIKMVFMCSIKTHMAECSCSDSCSCSPSSAPPSWKTDVCTPAAAVTRIPPRIPPFLSTVHSLSVK